MEFQIMTTVLEIILSQVFFYHYHKEFYLFLRWRMVEEVIQSPSLASTCIQGLGHRCTHTTHPTCTLKHINIRKLDSFRKILSQLLFYCCAKSTITKTAYKELIWVSQLQRSRVHEDHGGKPGCTQAWHWNSSGELTS